MLTARVAYLVHYWGLKPYEITAVSYNQGPRLHNVLDIALMIISELLRQVTFTNKAAQEMRKRLNVLLGPGTASRLILGEHPFVVIVRSGWSVLMMSTVRISGTFHATCAGYLRKHGQVIGLPNNFAIMDAEDA